MKYLKRFENKEKEYNIDDYIIVHNNIYVGTSKIFKIVDIVKNAYYPYNVIGVNGDIHFLEYKDIKRKLSKKEIEKYELDNISNKFNI